MTGSAATLLDELETALAHGSESRRAHTLRQVTDLFLLNAADYTNEQTSVFDDVFDVLVRNVELSAKALLAQRLAPVPSAPPRVIHKLAFDDEIEVAGPVLTHSERLTEQVLIETAQTKSQAHLLAISVRKVLPAAVTDVLVDRGDSNVVNSVVGNTGAQFSESGYKRLLELCERDDDLATCFGTRPAIPRHHFVKLLSRASNTVRSRLEALNSQSAADISAAVNDAALRAQNRSANENARMTAAEQLVEQLHTQGKLDGDQIAAFAAAGQFEETNAALAALANVPVSVVETLMIKSRSEGVMILAKVVDLPWLAVKAILDMRASLSGQQAPVDLNFCKVSYSRLKPATAQQVLRFHRMRQEKH